MAAASGGRAIAARRGEIPSLLTCPAATGAVSPHRPCQRRRPSPARLPLPGRRRSRLRFWTSRLHRHRCATSRARRPPAPPRSRRRHQMTRQLYTLCASLRRLPPYRQQRDEARLAPRASERIDPPTPAAHFAGHSAPRLARRDAARPRLLPSCPRRTGG